MKKIGKYVIRGLLGKGGMGVVYKARLPLLDRIVALKLLCPHPNLVSLLGQEAILGRFVSEAARIVSLRHPNIIEILDFDWEGEKPFFTMEYYYHDLGRLIGETYRPDLPSRILSLDKTIHYCRQILRGLSRLHRAGIVHRDIKPANLLISEEDRVKICDFGFSRIRGEKLNRPRHLVIGSPFYAAPEQERDPDAVDQRADLYSTGVIVHRMLTGYLSQEVTLKPSKYHPDAGPGWDAFIEKALESDPDRRFATPGHMLAALEELSERWDREKTLFCRYLPDAGTGEKAGNAVHQRPGAEGQRKKLRCAPVKASTRVAAALFGCDHLMRPLLYREEDSGFSVREDVVIDSRNGLVWQRSGSEDPLDQKGAYGYIEDLNSRRFCGCTKWRLPTVDELLATLKPPGLGIQDCFPPAFDKEQISIWSSDTCTFISGWYVHMELGFAGFADFTCHFHVRAVTEG